ncbi:hypothetical protein ACHWQZ_G001638 [Mnemiopsis leidyi]
MSPTVLCPALEDEKSDEETPVNTGVSSANFRVRNRRRSPEFTPVVMAAGCGSQMFELSHDRAGKTPKCMLPVANTPMIWYSVNFLIANKFEEIFVVVRQGDKDVIESYLTSSVRKLELDVHIEYVCIDDDADLGTADSLRIVAPKTKSDLLVISSDLITKVSLSELANVHRANNAALTALVAPRYSPPTPDGRRKRNKKDDRDFIGLDPEDDRILFIANEKDIEDEISIKRGQLTRFPHMRLHTNLLDSHLYLVSRTTLSMLDNHPDVSMMRCELLPLLVRKQIKQIVNTNYTVFADRIYSKKQDIDEDSKHPDEYFDILSEPESVGCYVHHTDSFTVRVNQLHNYIKYNKAVSENMDDIIPKNDVETCDISKMTQVGKCSRLGNSVKIAEKCSFKRSFIGNRVQIGPHCKIVDTVIMDDVTIEDNVSLTNCIVCKGVVIKNKCTLKDSRICDGFEVASGSDYVGESLVADSEIPNMMSFSIYNSGRGSDAEDLSK